MAPNRPSRAETRLALLRGARRVSRRVPEPWDRRLRELGKAVVNFGGARQTYLRGPWYALLGRRSGLLLARFGRGWMLVDTADQEIGRVVYVTGGYERIYMERAVEYLASVGRPVTGMTFIDVGANIGTSTVDALLHFGFRRALCFEADDRNVRLLRMNLILNDLDERASVSHVAVSDRDGEVRLERTEGNSGDTRVVETGRHPVPCAPLDALLTRAAVPLEQVGLVWIDVQGHEPAVLSGATALLQAGVPVVVEYSPGLLLQTETLDRLEKLIAEHYEHAVDLHALAQGAVHAAAVDARDLAVLAERYDAWDHTDLLLVR